MRSFITSNTITLLLLIFALAYLGWQRVPLYFQDSQVVGTYVADFELNGLHEATFVSQSLRGKKVLLYFFATWCGPCHMQRPFIKQVYQEMGSHDENFMMLTISQEHATKLKAYQKKHNIPYPIFIDTNAKLHAQLGINSYPTIVWLAEDGRVEDISHGLRPFLLYSLRYWLRGTLF